MKVGELTNYDIPGYCVQKLQEEKINELYPPQADVVKRNLLGQNLMISMPTAGGKTLIATLATARKLSENKCKIIYIVPLVALGNEKYQYFKKFFEGKYKVTLSVGEYDSSDPFLADYDIIVVTSEKMDSLLRHNIEWAENIGLIIVDEIHMINDSSRGPTLEILLTKLRGLCPRANTLALSATVNNAKELAEWLNATLVLSDFRPVKLYQGIAYNSKITFPSHKHSYDLSGGELEEDIVQHTIGMGKQCLFFVSTRKSAESLSEKLCKVTAFGLKRGERFQLENLAKEIENALEVPTKQCKALAKSVKCGVSFHHAGLIGQQKRLIEEGFRNGLVKVICATPTLAMGINIPAFRAVIRDAKRYYPGMGSVYIPVLDYYQMIGRCGRPQYDEFGESVLIARNEQDAEELTQRFIFGEPEDIRSKLAVEPVLRTHLMALIASEFCKTEDSVLDFFSKTFYAYHYGDASSMEEKIFEILNMLEEWDFIKKKEGKMKATLIGKRISELYIDPLTAHNFTESLSKANKRKITLPFSMLQTICNTLEMRPLPAVRSSEIADTHNTIMEFEKFFLQNVPEEYDLGFDDFFKSVKTAILLEEWANEATEDQILTKYKVAPGELKSRLANTDWLMYSMGEMALILGFKEILKDIRKLRVRMLYGIKPELMQLVKLKDIGRVRSRKLFNAGFKALDDLRNASLQSISAAVGQTVAANVKRQLEGNPVKTSKETQKTLSMV